MNNPAHPLAPCLLIFATALIAPPDVSGESGRPDLVDQRINETIGGLVETFQDHTDAIWPGFALHDRPLLVYRPEHWAAFLNGAATSDAFQDDPPPWFDPGVPFVFHRGAYDGLVGQLAFDLKVGDILTVAIGLPEHLPQIPGSGSMSFEQFVLSFTAHEAFHQYQSESFGELPWAREELYPILDAANTSGIALEMHVLAAALDALKRDDINAMKARAREFVTIREDRWKSAPPIVRQLEQSLELREGTAKYVEARAIGFTCASTDLSGTEPMSAAIDWIRVDLEGRFRGHSLAPADVPRNRIYSVAAAQALILDALRVEWKAEAQRGGEEFSFASLLSMHLPEVNDSIETLLASVRQRLDLEAIEEATAALIGDYLSGYREALDQFRRQEGVALEITLGTNGLRRSRVSDQTRWVMDTGSIALCSLYQVYTLERDNVTLQIHDAAVLERDDWDRKVRTVVVYAKEPLAILSGGAPVMLLPSRVVAFQSLEMEAANISLHLEVPGTLERTDRGYSIIIDADGSAPRSQ